jgi:Cu+-exporting ATPase
LKKTFDVKGMTCAACSSAVERIVRRQAGIIAASVNLTTNKLTAEFDEDVFDIELMINKVAKAGFQVKEEENLKTVVMPIAGMT